MLVALAITGMLVSVLMSSLFYIFRVQESVRDEVVVREQALRARAWFREILSNCLPVEDKEPLAFKGSAKEITCESTGAIIPAALPIIATIKLSLTEEDQRAVLNYQEDNGSSSDSEKGFELASWNVRDIEFRFIDSKGEEQDHWPPEKTPYEALPRKIKLRFGNARSMNAETENPWQVAMKSDPWMPEKQALPPGMTMDMFK